MAVQQLFKEVKMAYIIDDSCIACGACMADCPTDAIAEGDIYTIDAEKCIDCGVCSNTCPIGAAKEE